MSSHSRPLSSPPRMVSDYSDEESGYVVLRPDEPSAFQDYMLPYIAPVFETAVNALSPIMAGVLSSDAGRAIGGYDYMGLADSALSAFTDPGSWPRDYAYWLTESLLGSDGSYTPPSPRLVGVETNPGPPKSSGLSKSAARRLRRRLAAAKTKPAQPPRPMPRQSLPSRTMPAGVAAAYSTGMVTGKPVIIRTGDDSTRIRHSELLTLVNGTVNFTATSFSMQPGLVTVFPWLSTQTVGWEKYKWHSLRATYFTRCGTSTPGSVIMAPDYDAADSPPSSEQQATSFHGAADDAPWKTIVVNFDMKRSRELFLRGGPLSANLDIKTYDFANLYVCTADGTATNWGKIFVEYDVELINPQILQGPYVGGSVIGGGTQVTTNPFGTNPNVTPGSVIASCVSNGTDSVISLQNLVVGQAYELLVFITGTGVGTLTTIYTGGTTITQIDDLTSSSSTRVLDLIRVVPTASTGSVTVHVVATTITDARLYFSAISSPAV